ncbi:hypothetical protein B0O80DRAFT_496213 [Mortierella sp. GBAus27b]|nr:hypothetical protein BGX31_001896 [Mortierella sp. GBA43]KAI8357447.1 hypothetical protein B0O80DRAFT_496213 [Mortierella sp. GBAus27b]
MTHLSDYSFIQRAIANGWFYVWFVGYVFMYDRFSALHYQRMVRFELRSVVTFLLLIAIPLHLAYDIGSTSIKYREGFWEIPESQQIISKPSNLWTQPNQDTAEALDYALACGMALLTSIFFLLQAFYHYISKSVTKTSFMSSLEFRLNIACSITLLTIFPLIQYLFRKNLAFREAAPQMAFSSVLLIIAFLGVRTHFRFKSLLKVALLTVNENSQGVAEKLEYFKDMNVVLTLAMAGSGLSLGIASADGLRATPTIAHNKFASDLLIANLNFFEFIIWVTVVLIFYPRRSVVGSAFGQSSGTLSRTAPTSTRVNIEYPKSPSTATNEQQLSYSASTSGARSSTRKGERPPSVVIPYKAPENARSEYVDIQMSPRNTHDSIGFNDHDTYPLTKGTADAQLNSSRTLYDDPLQTAMERTSLPRQKVYNNRFQSPPQTPVSPSSSRHGAISPMSFDHPQRVASPTSPVFGSGVPRPAAAATARVGQHTFVLEDAPRASAAPPRARKEYRGAPQY